MGKREEADLARRSHNLQTERTTTLRDELVAAENLAARLVNVEPGSAEYLELSRQYATARTTYSNHKALLDLEEAALAEEEERLYPGSYTGGAATKSPIQTVGEPTRAAVIQSPPVADSQGGNVGDDHRTRPKGGAPSVKANDWLYEKKSSEPQTPLSELEDDYIQRRKDENRPLPDHADVPSTMRDAIRYRRRRERLKDEAQKRSGGG